MNKDAVKVRLFTDIKHNVVCFFEKLVNSSVGTFTFLPLMISDDFLMLYSATNVLYSYIW